MEPKKQDRGEFLVEQEQRLEAISDLLGGYGPGDLLGDPVLDEDLAF